MPKKTAVPGLRIVKPTLRRANPRRAKLNWVQELIGIRDIDPSPYQRRRYFDEDKLKELAASIQREGLIEPIVVRPNKKRYELIAGERRLRAVRDYTDIKTIHAQVVHAGDIEARRISAAENMQREDFSAIEVIEAIVEIVDAELIEDTEYSSMGKTSMDRVKTLLGKLDSVRRSEALGYEVTTQARRTSNKFIGSVEEIFQNLPNPLKWLSFYLNDLPLVIDFCEEVRDASVERHLNKSQTRALAKLKEASEEEFQRMITPVCHAEHSKGGQDQTPLWSESARIHKRSHTIDLRALSAREIEEIARKAARKRAVTEQNRPRVSPPFSMETKILTMGRLGVPAGRIAARLKVNRLTAMKYSNDPGPVESIRAFLRRGLSIRQVAEEHGYPEPLVWSVAFEGKSDQERSKRPGGRCGSEHSHR